MADISETAKREEQVLELWRNDNTFQKSLEKDAPQGEFVFYDGPPFATGLPHHGSLLSSIVKDVVPRYKTMRGFRVRRRWGWDCHGLPIESLVEKELGLKTKKDIQTIGVKAFNEKARSMVLQFVHDWEKYVERVGRWVDFSNSYKTMDNSFIESVWWALRQLWDKKKLYEGRKVLMYCTHCETPLAKAEIAMDNTYKDVTEEAVTVKFKVKNPGKHSLPENTYILAWTTTPWTLPGNVGLAIGEEVSYVVFDHEGQAFIQAEALYKGTTSIKKIQGRDLVGIEYEPLYEIPLVKNHTGKKHVVLPADFVTTTDGTGIVHTAVMYGEDDFTLGQKEGLPMVQLLSANGSFTDDAPEFIRGKYIKDAEKDIKKDLESRGLMFERKNNTHSYPHCYRCGTPLIYNAVSSWFLDIQSVKEKMISENQKINWVPSHLRDGRFGNIVANAPDWTISRNRFWASPLPIWKQKDGTEIMVMGSLAEIRAHVKTSGNTYTALRHGEAENNVRGILNSTNEPSLHLTPKGKEQIAETLIKLSKPDLIFASPITRTQETARAVAAHFGIPETEIITDERIIEVQFGEFNGKPRDEYIGKFENTVERYTKKLGNVESWSEVRARVGTFLSELESTYTGKNILIVSHDATILVLSGLARGETKEQTAYRADHPQSGDDHFSKNAGITNIPYVPMPFNDAFEIDLHRPYIDSLVLVDDAGREYERIPEVVDCWVESGSMPFAEQHYPFENKEGFEKRAPGDFIAEYIAQTRTWFYYMHALGVLLFDRLAFKNVVSTGTILAGNGEKISKSKRNYTDPLELIGQYGSDSLRFYLMSSPVMQSEDVRFRDEDVRDAHNRVISMLWNTCKFYELYKGEYDGVTTAAASTHILDRWIHARLQETISAVTVAMDAYDTPHTCRVLRDFIEDYSTWYVRRSRERMKENNADMQSALATQKECLMIVAQLIAPIAPFIAESVWQTVGGKGSVHLTEWPEVETTLWAKLFGDKSETILTDMQATRNAVSRALEARDKAKMKVRQPLASLTLSKEKYNLAPEMLEIIAEEINVKKVIYGAVEDAELDTVLTPELTREGDVRELVRAVQALRKKKGLQLSDKAQLAVSESAHEIIESAREELTRAGINEIVFDANEGETITLSSGTITARLL